mmetsp:Transcript_13688/g.34866  ORF Transcript_13688/g.34866 Transcript_13688/m.34866 type:complete len:369 (+) Transcript_13688:3-1109(+)
MAALVISLLASGAASAMVQRRPPAELPPFLRASDGAATFTFDTVSRRLPAIVRSTIASNRYAAPLAAELEALASNIAADALLVPLADAAWNAHPQMAEALAARESWHSASWWLVENYLYKRILQSTAKHGETADPFRRQKTEALEASERALLTSILPLFGTAAAAGGKRHAHAPLGHFLYRSLWGNRADLSISAGDGKSAVSGAEAMEERSRLVGVADATRGEGAPVPLEAVRDGSKLLCDDMAQVIAALPTDSRGAVLLLLDNAGLELLTDLALAAAMLSLGHCATLELVAKDTPTFVSDATPADVDSTIDWLRAHQGEGARTLAQQVGAVAVGDSQGGRELPPPALRRALAARKHPRQHTRRQLAG